MLRIRKEQMEWWGQKSRQKFVTSMADYLEQNFAWCVNEMSRQELLDWVSDATAKAKQYGVVTEPEVAQLILLFLVLGVDSDAKLPWVKEALSDRELYSIGKVRRLVTRAREEAIQGIDLVVVKEIVDA